MSLDRGYLYIAMGSEHLTEAIESMKRLKVVDKNAHVTLVTTRFVDVGFDRCIVKPQGDPSTGGIGYKVDQLSCEYYKHTMFVDTDTYFVEDCSLLLDRTYLEYDMAIMPDPAEVEIDPGAVAYNTGVVVMHQNANIEEMLKLFKRYYINFDIRTNSLKGHPAAKQISDQPVFMMAVRDSRVKVLPLPSNYNFRYRFPVSVNGRVKLIHGPRPEGGWESLAAKVNKTIEPRVWTRNSIYGN